MIMRDKKNRAFRGILLFGLALACCAISVPEVSAQTYDFDEGIEVLTKGLISENREILKNKKIAVFGIIESRSEKKWEVSSFIEDGIVDVLVKNGCRVIERRRIQDVIQEELKKVTDLWFDQNSIARFGKLVGADFVVTGRYVLWGQGMLKISIRAIKVADGTIVAADKVQVHTDRIANLLKSEEKEEPTKEAKANLEKPIEVKSIDDLSHKSGKLGEYKALIIGINDYKGPKIPDLKTPINDATSIAKVLKEKYEFKVKLLLDREATKEAIYKELRSLAVSTKPNDSVLIYFAGHGDLDRTYDGGWWIPADAIGGNPVTYLDNLQVQKAMRSMKARHVLLISDSCYSGTLFGESRSLPPVIDDKYYLSLYNEKSRWGMTSGNKTPVSDQGTDGHSVFAYQLIKELGESDKPFLSTQELYARIAPVISNNSEQTPLCRPILNAGDQGGEFVFVASLEKKPPPTIPWTQKDSIDKEILFWKSIQDSEDPALFEAYVQAFPNGVFVPIAKRKIEGLKQEKRIASIPPEPGKSRLFVKVEPTDARVRILNISPKFYQGMELVPGSYNVETSKQGYITQEKWVDLGAGENRRFEVRLEQLQVSIQPATTYTRPSSSTSNVMERDGIYVAYANGIVKDTKTGLEWKAGPDKDTTWDEARSWVQSLNLDGGGWRMPTMDELEGLYKKGMGSHNITSLLKTTSPYLWIWSGEAQGSSDARYFYFYNGDRSWYSRDYSGGVRGFAVRSQQGSKKQEIEVAGLQQKPSYPRPSSTSSEIERDGIYVAYANSIVKDTKTGLEWKVGPDKDTTWEGAKSWVQSLNIDGGGWRMPTEDQLKSLYREGVGTRNMTSLLKTTGWWVWTSKVSNSPQNAPGFMGLFSRTACSSCGWIFYFARGGYGYWVERGDSSNMRAFAVRSRSDG